MSRLIPAKMIRLPTSLQKHRHSRAGGNPDERRESCFLDSRLRWSDEKTELVDGLQK